MIRSCFRSTALILLSLTAAPSIAAQRYALDPDRSWIRFSVPYDFMIVGQVDGRFRTFSGHVDYEAADLTASSVEVRIETASLDTGLAARDLGLKGELFFDSERHPEIVFRSQRVVSDEDGFRLEGTLTMRGAEQPASIPFELLDFGKALVVLGETRVERLDFGMRGPLPSPDFVIGDTVTVRLSLTLVREEP